MKLELVRTYFTEGTNGILRQNGFILCYTIELPWKENQHGISCIPEGEYALAKRYSKKFGRHLLVLGVENRNLILIHPANNSLKELKGCIAPVSSLTGPGKGRQSSIVFVKLVELVYKAIEKKETILFNICSSTQLR